MPDTVITKYPYVLLTVATRKEGFTREQFRKHNEEIYAPLLKKTAGKLHPLAWSRRYHVDEGEGPKGIPRIIIGDDEGLDWDCFGEMTFADELHCQQFITFLQTEAAEPIIEEEGNFVQVEKTKLMVFRRELSLGQRAELQKLE